jgi:hypothetical protein
MRHTGNGRHQVPPEFKADVMMWCAANKRIADWLAQFDYPADRDPPGRPDLRLVPAPPPRVSACLTPQHARPRRNWLAPVYRALTWQRCISLAFVLHPGFIRPEFVHP